MLTVLTKVEMLLSSEVRLMMAINPDWMRIQLQLHRTMAC